MSREDRCKLAINKGYVYDPITGIVKNRLGKEITKKVNGYTYMKLGIYTHQFAWYYMYNECVECIDHINRIKTDNRIENLRSITSHQNKFNTNAKGYCYDKDIKKFRSYIALNGKTKHLGVFTDESEARQVYLDAKKEYHII